MVPKLFSLLQQILSDFTAEQKDRRTRFPLLNWSPSFKVWKKSCTVSQQNAWYFYCDISKSVFHWLHSDKLLHHFSWNCKAPGSSVTGEVQTEQSRTVSRAEIHRFLHASNCQKYFFKHPTVTLTSEEASSRWMFPVGVCTAPIGWLLAAVAALGRALPRGVRGVWCGAGRAASREGPWILPVGGDTVLA